MIRSRRVRRSEIPQASLADIAFLLLIFFLAVTTFTAELGLPLVLPSARTSAILSVRPDQVFRIEGHADGAVVANGHPARIGDLAAILRRTNQGRRAAGHDEVVVLIETDPRAPYDTMLQILDQVRAAECRRIALKQLGGG